MPLGVFVIVHLSVNASIGAGGDEFQKQVDRLHALGPFLVPVEIVGIFLPLLFHAVLGLKIWFSGSPNLAAYKYGGNYRYTLQRVSGGIAFVFILFHVWQMHWLGNPFGGGVFDAHDAAVTTAGALRESIWVVPVSVFYVIGVVCTVYHLANGIWTSLITWGITIGPSSQRMAGYACAAFGLVVGVAGLSSVYNFRRFEGGAATARVTPATDAPGPMNQHSNSSG